jgi:putative Holliday junction resolvase
MKYLGRDYGTRRIGVAVSDDSGSIAFAHSVLENNNDFFSSLINICKKEKVEAIVLGESKDFSGKENVIMPAVHELEKKLEEKLGLPVFLEPEFMTSQEARHIQGENEMHDASAAALILKSYLDKRNDNNR